MATSMAPPPGPSAAAAGGGAAAESADHQSPPQEESMSTAADPSSSEAPPMKTPMGPPQNPSSSPPSTTDNDDPPDSTSSDGAGGAAPRAERIHHSRPSVPYKTPPWSAPPCHSYSLEVLKEGSIIDQLDVTKKGAYMFGRADICDFVLENPTVSRFHAVLQFNGSGEAFLYDLGSSHGSFINKSQVEKKSYVELHVGDVIRFGLSTRLYILQGPTDLMPPESDIKSIKQAKHRLLEKQDREASLRRAREEAALADGISWGMGEDAIEEAEDETDEITWQTYKGELTEKQEKTRSKVLKRLEKIAHMKKEMDAIRAKDISQGGLTQGQQTQIARNEQRISQLLEELESLEETLNDSIRESLGARTGFSYGKKKWVAEEEEGILSDEDEFYDRTRKKPSTNKSRDSQSVETADSLLDKKEAIMKEMEEKTKLLQDEKSKLSEPPAQPETGDALDAFMSGLSSKLKHDTAEQLEKGLSVLQTELDRILYLLKVADPTGEAAKKRQSAIQQGKYKEPERATNPIPTKPIKAPPQAKKIIKPDKIPNDPTKNNQKATSDASEATTEGNNEFKKPKPFTVVKPQWLGAAIDGGEKGQAQLQESSEDANGGDDFVDYKDRNKILDKRVEVGLEDAAPGLIIRKKKQVEENREDEVDDSEESTSSRADEMKAEDAVALLLKHKRGYYDMDEDGKEEDQSDEDSKRPRRVLGPEKPPFVDSNMTYESWVPPKGQTGDGRTSLNDRLGY